MLVSTLFDSFSVLKRLAEMSAAEVVQPTVVENGQTQKPSAPANASNRPAAPTASAAPARAPVTQKVSSLVSLYFCFLIHFLLPIKKMCCPQTNFSEVDTLLLIE